MTPLNSVIICCTTDTTLNRLSRGTLLTFGAQTDWSVYCCCTGNGTLTISTAVGPASGTWHVWGSCLLRMVSQSHHEGQSWHVIVKRDYPSCHGLWCSLQFPLTDLVLHMAAAPTVGWTGFPSVHQLAVAACWCRRVGIPCVGGHHHTTCNEEVGYSLPRYCQISGSFNIVLGHSDFLCLHPDRDVTKACQFKDILGLLSPG
jgi:hypothetical protein